TPCRARAGVLWTGRHHDAPVDGARRREQVRWLRAGPAPARSARRRPRHRGPVVPAQTAACGLPLACAACRPLGALEASTLPVGGGRGTALVGTLLRLTACELDPAGGRPER